MMWLMAQCGPAPSAPHPPATTPAVRRTTQAPGLVPTTTDQGKQEATAVVKKSDCSRQIVPGPGSRVPSNVEIRDARSPQEPTF
jgi:hypothetical protein